MLNPVRPNQSTEGEEHDRRTESDHHHGDKTYYLPFDYNLVSQSREGGYTYDPLGTSCSLTYGEGKRFKLSHPFPAEKVAKQIQFGWKRRAANVLLATAPDHSSRMRPEDVE